MEWIAERYLRIEILPLLEARSSGWEGSLTQDLQTIIVDDRMMARYPARFRVTIAHDIGHRVLHGTFIQSLDWETEAPWKKFLLGYDPEAYGRLESQAHRFAGHLLVPTDALSASCERTHEFALAHGVDLGVMGADARPYVANHIAREYDVPAMVVARRLAEEDLP